MWVPIAIGCLLWQVGNVGLGEQFMRGMGKMGEIMTEWAQGNVYENFVLQVKTNRKHAPKSKC